LHMNTGNKKQVASNHMKNTNWALLKQDEFWDEFFFRIGNGESLRGVSRDLGVPFQTVWSAIMIDERRKATYEDAKMSRAHFHAAKIEEIIEEVELGNIDPQVARVSIDARKWLASKMYPKFFSDRIQLQHDVTVDVRKQHIEELRQMNRKKMNKSNFKTSDDTCSL